MLDIIETLIGFEVFVSLYVEYSYLELVYSILK